MLMEVIFYPVVACYMNGLEKPQAPVCWSGVDDQNWDKIGQSEDGCHSAQGGAEKSSHCSFVVSPYYFIFLKAPWKLNIETEMWDVLESCTVGMKILIV